MQTCRKCGFTNLVWKKYYGKRKLWDTKTRRFHFEQCSMSQEEYKEFRQERLSWDKCKHGIFTSKYCPRCYDEQWKKA